MPLVRILKDFQAVEGWVVGQIVGMSNHETLVREGKVEVVPDDTVETTPDEVQAVDNSLPEAAPIVATSAVPTPDPVVPNVLEAAKAAAQSQPEAEDPGVEPEGSETVEEK